MTPCSKRFPIARWQGQSGQAAPRIGRSTVQIKVSVRKPQRRAHLYRLEGRTTFPGLRGEGGDGLNGPEK